VTEKEFDLLDGQF